MTNPNDRAAEIEDAIKKADAEKAEAERLEGTKLDKVLSHLGTMAPALESLSKRVDALESAKTPPDDKKPEAAADDEDAEAGELAEIQGRADSVANAFGEQAPAPLSGEKAMAYRRRLLRPFQQHSAEFGKVDLKGIDDPAVFAAIETRIYADAVAASSNPAVYEGGLREVKRRDESGRVITTFYGQPRVWMKNFSGARQRVTKFNRDAS